VAVATGLVPIAIGTVDAEVSDAVADVVSVLRAHAAHVDQATLASLHTYQECGSTILHVEAFKQLVTVTTLRPSGPAFDADTSDDTSSTLSPRMPFNVVGAPAVAAPISLTAKGLPLSMQLVGARGADDQLLALAHVCEQALGGRVQRLTARRS
jgi:amidase